MFLSLWVINCHCEDFDEDLKRAWKAVDENAFAKEVTSEILYGASQGIKMNDFPGDVAIAAINLFIANREDTLLLAWIEQKNRAERIVIASLIVCQKSDIRDNYMKRFQDIANRFSLKEASQRIDELKYIESNQHVIAGRIFEKLKNILEPSRLKKFELLAKEK